MFKNHKIFPILFLLFSCKSMSNVQLYDEVGLPVDSYESFQYKNIFSDSQFGEYREAELLSVVVK